MNHLVVILVMMILIIGIGWVKNLIKLTECDFKPPFKAELIHTAGLFPLIGMVTGWIDCGN